MENIEKELEKINMSVEDYESCLSDIYDKLDGNLDMEWDEIKEKYNIPYASDVLRKANGTLFGGYAVRKYMDSKRPVTCGDSRIYDIRKEKQKLFDERAALVKIKRDEARCEENLDILRREITEAGKLKYKPSVIKTTNGDTDMIICLSDLHIGEDVDSWGGKYNSTIAKERLDEYLGNILKIQKSNASRDAYVLLLGDLVSGNIHPTVQLQNRENVIEQVVKASELVSDFLYELSKHFENVFINNVGGNHSRIGLKENVLRNERLDSIVPWYCKAKLEHLTNIIFIDEFNYDPSIGSVVIRDKEYLVVHGDWDGADQSSVAKLVFMIGHIPEAVIMGHLHNNSFQNISNVKVIRSGSLCGTGDDYTMSKRIVGAPEQMVLVVDEGGIRSLHPVTFN